MVERQLPKLNVKGSNPFTRSFPFTVVKVLRGISRQPLCQVLAATFLVVNFRLQSLWKRAETPKSLLAFYHVSLFGTSGVMFSGSVVLRAVRHYRALE